jgi:hypothetical protein
MSFADFLRYHWEREEAGMGDADVDEQAAEVQQHDEVHNQMRAEPAPQLVPSAKSEETRIPLDEDGSTRQQTPTQHTELSTTTEQFGMNHMPQAAMEQRPREQGDMHISWFQQETKSAEVTELSENKFDKMLWTPPTPPKPRPSSSDSATTEDAADREYDAVMAVEDEIEQPEDAAVQANEPEVPQADQG